MTYKYENPSALPFVPPLASRAAFGSGFLPLTASLGSISSSFVPFNLSSASFLRSSFILFFSSSLLKSQIAN